MDKITVRTKRIVNGSTAEVARYMPQIVEEYKGNPLIEALPPIYDFETLLEILSVIPPYSNEERKLPVHYRMHKVQNLFRYLQPWQKHFDLEGNISRSIRQGYISRNPLSSNYVGILNHADMALEEEIPIWEFYSKDERKQAFGFTLIGASGSGKSTAIDRIMSLYPKVIQHHDYKDKNIKMLQLVYLKVECPFDGTLKGLCFNYFLKVDEILGTNYHVRFGNSRNSVNVLISQMVQIANNHSLGLLIIDEVQHLREASGNGAKKMLNFFVTLVNMIGLPVVLIGTTKALGILRSEFREGRRGSGQGEVTWEPLKNDDYWNLIIEGMWGYQWTSTPTPLTEEFRDILFDESQGIIDIAIKLYILTQLNAMKTDGEIITPALMRRTAKECFVLVQPMLEALRTGDLSKLALYEDIRPIDITEFINMKTNDIAVLKAAKEHRDAIRNMETEKKNDIVSDIIDKLLDMRISPQLANKAATTIVKEMGIDKDFGDLLSSAFLYAHEQKIKKEERKGSHKGTRKQKGKLISLYLKANKEKIDVIDAFDASGLIKCPSKDFMLKGLI